MKSPIPFAIAGCALLLLVAVAICGHRTDAELESYKASIERLNERLPAKVDGETEVETVRFEPASREIRYTYVVLHYDANNFDHSEFARGARAEHRHSLCKQNRSGLHSASAEGLRMRHTYLGADGRFIASVVMNPRTCQTQVDQPL